MNRPRTTHAAARAILRPALPIAIVAAGMLQSCIADEPLNAECDLTAISLHLDNPTDIFYAASDTIQYVLTSDSNIQFLIRNRSNVTTLPVTVSVTDGAMPYLLTGGIETPFTNGTSVDFSGERVQTLRVKSQDGNWHRDYTACVRHDVPTEGDLAFDFETYHLDKTGKYYEWDITDDNARNVFTDAMWKNGNPGYKLAKSSASPMDYPSTPIADGGPDGSACVCLETKATGSFGAMVNMRFASGSMFNGIFDVSNALKDALKATRFGSPFKHRPERMRVWMRFERGETFQDRQANPIPGVVDEPDAYVVFYRNQDESGNRIMLDGSEILSSPRIVALGRLPHRYNADGTDQLTADPIHGVTAQWQEFIIPLVYRTEVDPDILESNGYSLAIGFASSWQGNLFMGAVGNRLYIDNIQLECIKD